MPHYSRNIHYQSTKDGWIVTQQLESISLYSLEGELSRVASFVREETGRLISKYTNPIEISADYFIDAAARVSPVTKQTVQFDTLKLDWQTEYEDRVLRVVGTRKVIPAEQAAIDEEKRLQEERQLQVEKAKFLELKKKFEP